MPDGGAKLTGVLLVQAKQQLLLAAFQNVKRAVMDSEKGFFAQPAFLLEALLVVTERREGGAAGNKVMDIAFLRSARL